jgi:hypothetical protein
MTVSEFDERKYLHTFLLRWGTAGKLPRFIIDGRAYDTSEAVKVDIREAGRTLDRLDIPHELESSPIGPNDHGPILPSWCEFRVGLAALDLDPWPQD